jgi:nucleoside-diphosphate-sugar epimerase
VLWCDSLDDADTCLGKLEGASFSAVVDNWSKSPEQVTPYAQAAKDWGVATYAFVSSAGMYTPEKGDDSAVSEECAVKSSGQRQAEETIAEMGLPYSYFRPQYIYGPCQGKSYLSFFFDRLSRGRPVRRPPPRSAHRAALTAPAAPAVLATLAKQLVLLALIAHASPSAVVAECGRRSQVPVPNAGDQPLTMTHAADNAAMIAAAVGNPAAVGQAFNCATSSLVTYDELVQLCAKAAGVEAEIAHYDPKGFEKPDEFKFKFPFRDTPFYVSVDKAQQLLSFKEANVIASDIEWCVPTMPAPRARVRVCTCPCVPASGALRLALLPGSPTIWRVARCRCRAAASVVRYYKDNYVAQKGLEKDLDFSDDDIVLTARK